MSNSNLTGRSALRYIMLLVVFLSIFSILPLKAVASEDIPYSDIGTEWTMNPNLLVSEGAWDARVWQWSTTSLELQHNSADNHVLWNTNGYVELQASDALGGSYQASNLDQGYEKYENEISNLNEWGDWDNKTRSLKVEGEVIVFENVEYSGNSRTFTSDTSDLGEFDWDYKISSFKLAQGSRVTIYSDTGYEGNSRTFVYPSHQPPELEVSDKDSITLEGVVSDLHTDTSTFPGWTGAKFDVFAVEDRYSDAGSILMIEMYFLRDGANLAWSSYNLLQGCSGSENEGFRGPPFQSAYNYLLALDAFPEYANMTTYPGNTVKWIVDVKALMQRACDHEWGVEPSTHQLDIKNFKIVKVSFTVESARIVNPARAACVLNRLRLAYNEEREVYSEYAVDKLQDGASWFKINDSSAPSGLVMKAAASSPNGGVLYGPYITTGAIGESLAGKPYKAVFRLKVSSNALSDNVVYLDVCHNAGEVITSHLCRASDFAASNEWQSFELPFTAPRSMMHGLEFRVINRNNGFTDLFIDEVTLWENKDKWALYSEGAFSKPQSGNSWILVNDSSSYYGQVMKASETTQNYACLYGPYIKSASGIELKGEPLVISFSLKTNTNSGFEPVAQIDVAFDAGIVIKSKQIRANEFLSPNEWQEFTIEIIAPDILNTGLEFRVFNLNKGIADLFLEGIYLVRNIAVVYKEDAHNKLTSGSSWIPWNDSTSLSGTTMKASKTEPNWGVLYGPYIKTDELGVDMHGRDYVARFRMKVSTNISIDIVAYLDVCYDLGLVIAQKVVMGYDFHSSNEWQEFEIMFQAPEIMDHGLEFRVINLNHEIADLLIDGITISNI